jgi:linearmycin/streptolysin S transport system permease protein
MRRGFVVCAKDMRQRIRDRTAVTVGVVAPIVLTGIIGVALANDEGPSPPTPIAWVDLDGSAVSNALLRSFTEDWPARRVAVVRVATAEDAEAAVSAGRYAAAIIVPAGLEATLSGGGARPTLRVRTGRTFALGGRFANALAKRATVIAQRVAPQVDVRAPQGGTLRSIDHYGPSLTVLFLFFQLLGGLRAFGAEGATGTLARLAATPATGREIVGGKLLALALLGALQFAVLYGVTRFAFGVSWGPPSLVAALAATTIASAIGLMGTVIAAAGPYRGYLLGTLLLFVLSLLGGQFLPPEGLPDVFDELARLTPNGQALRGLTDLAAAGADASLATIAEPLLVTAAVGVVGILACARKLGVAATPIA